MVLHPFLSVRLLLALSSILVLNMAPGSSPLPIVGIVHFHNTSIICYILKYGLKSSIFFTGRLFKPSLMFGSSLPE
jgi:hypothetical protein